MRRAAGRGAPRRGPQGSPTDLLHERNAFLIGVKMSIRTWSAVVLLFLVASVPFAVIAQSPPAASGATLHGVVLDPDNALIPGATLALTSASGTAQSTVSKSDGTYTFRNLATGAYVLNVTAPGFARSEE